MKKFILKHKTLWISIIAAALIIISMDSCTSTRVGCAQHLGYIGYK